MSSPIKPYKPSDWVIEPGTPEHDAYMAAKEQQTALTKFTPKTPEQVREEFQRKGLSFSAWAKARGVSTRLTEEILKGRRKAIRGESHAIAVLLGLKDGEVPDQYRRAA